MTTPTKARKPRVPPTPAPSTEQAAAPEAFVLPTSLLVDLIKLVGQLPAQQVGTVYLQLQRLAPLVPDANGKGESAPE